MIKAKDLKEYAEKNDRLIRQSLEMIKNNLDESIQANMQTLEEIKKLEAEFKTNTNNTLAKLS